MTKQLQIKCLDKFKPLIQKRKRVKIIVGGRASTKTTFVADYVAACVSGGQLWCCGREFQNSIDESVHRTLQEEIERLNLPGFSALKTEITHQSGGRTFYRGLSRNILSLKGILSGVDGLWVEEAEGLSEDSLRVLTASTRATAADFDAAVKAGIPLSEMKSPEIWLTMNRGSRSDPVAEKFLARAEDELERCGYYEDDEIMVVEANYNDMPRKWFLGSGLEEERKSDKERLSLQQYEHKWLGRYMESIDDAIIQAEWFDACVDAHKKLGITPRGARVTAYDPADTGDDKNAVASRLGILFDTVEEIDQPNGNLACDDACTISRQKITDLFVWDGDGMGALLRKQIGQNFEGTKLETRMYRGSESVDNPNEAYDGVYSEGQKTNREMFANKRSQYYILLAKRMQKTWDAVENGTYIDPDELVSISSDIKLLAKLRSEVCGIPRKRNFVGKIALMSKEELASKYGRKSPNMADCLAMAMEQPDLGSEPLNIEFEGWG